MTNDTTLDLVNDLLSESETDQIDFRYDGLSQTTPFKDLPSGVKELLQGYLNKPEKHWRHLAVIFNSCFTEKKSYFLYSLSIHNILLKAVKNQRNEFYPEQHL
jgi:hypothetical protein